MKNLKKPSFIMFVIGVILVFMGIGMKSYELRISEYLMYSGFALFGIFWIWSISMVITAIDLKPFQKRFWMIAVIAVPVLGGLLFHLMHNRAGRIIS